MKKASCQHQHAYKKCKEHKFQAIKAYLESLSPYPVDPSTLKRVICPQYAISEKQFYYILARSRGRSLEAEELVENLEKEGFEVFISEEIRGKGQPPEIMVVANEEMRRQFKKYGNSVSFDLTFNLIKNQHPSGSKWKLGIFLAVTACRHIVPLAFVVTLFETTEAYVQIFRTFFRAMEGQPGIVVTDEERAIHAAL